VPPGSGENSDRCGIVGLEIIERLKPSANTGSGIVESRIVSSSRRDYGDIR